MMSILIKRMGLALVIAFFVAFPAVGYAASPLQQRATPTPTPTSTPTPVPPTATATPSPEPTTTAPDLTPTPTFTATPVPPTVTPTVPPGNTPVPPTATHTPAPQPTHMPQPTATKSDTGTKSGNSNANSQCCFSRVEGFVVDAQGAGWPGVLVRLRGDGWQAEWLTDSNGFFYFNNLGAGKAVIEALVEGQVLARDVIETTGSQGEVIALRLVLGQTGMATATPTPSPTETPQIQDVLPATGNDAGAFSELWLLVAVLFGLSWVGVVVLRRRFG